MIELDRLYKRYGEQELFHGRSFRFEEGITHVLFGASGSGKTTLLRLLMGLTEPDHGSIRGLEGKRISAVFQENRLCESLTVSRNICSPLPRGSREERQRLLRRIETALRELGMPGTAGQRVSTLSGGMKRRTAILRALFCPAEIYIFDEACQGLDGENKRRVMERILRTTCGRTVFWVTHDREELLYFPDARCWELGDSSISFAKNEENPCNV